jgi:prolyl-tRNA editing enzyme YbaK/EbsC (Cys-tRNA(Pro) deacylase)
VAARGPPALTVHASTQRVADILAAAGADAEIREFDESTRTARHAAAALGCPLGAIASSLVFMADGVPLLIVTSGAHRVDVDLVASALGVTELRQATPDEVRAATGYPIGGVAPVGHPQPLRTLVDDLLREFDVLWAAAGTPRAVFSTTYDDLVRVTGGDPVTVA